jgi:hypothetical protein
VDWNCNGVASGAASVDLNVDGVKGDLVSWNNWGTLTYGGGAIGADASPARLAPAKALPNELTWEQAQKFGR